MSTGGPAELRVARTSGDLDELDRWLLRRADRVLGLDLETNGADPWHRGFRARAVQVADEDAAWLVPVWSPDGHLTCGARLAAALRRHPRFVAHYAEKDVAFAMRGLLGGPDPIRLGEREPHVADLQTALALYEPRTVTTHSKKDRIDPRIPLRRALKPTAQRYGYPELPAAEAALHARFRELAPAGSRTKNASLAWGFAAVPDDDPAYVLYALLDPLVTVRLWHRFTRELERRGQGGRLRAALADQWDMDCATYAGVAVDEPYARWLHAQLEAVVAGLGARLAEHGVPPSGQGPAVAAAFASLGVETVRATPGGDASWDRHALTELIDRLGAPTAEPARIDRARAQELARAVLDVRRATKFSAAYVAPMLRACALGDGASHASVRAIGAVTTRMSAQGTESSGALQQMPKRDVRVRACYRARRGRTFVSADYRQAEPHVMAALSGDPVMLADLTAPHPALGHPDHNSHVATTVYGDAYDPRRGKEAGTPHYAMRQACKFAWLAWCYGCAARKLAGLLGRPVEEGATIIERWRGRYPIFAAWQDEMNSRAEIRLDSGAVVPLWDRAWVDDEGRIRQRTDHMGRPVASRLGPNAATQGGQRDLLGVSMHRLRHWGWSWALRMAMHDELLLEVPEPMAPEAVRVLGEAMTVVYRGVRIGCEATVEGRTWTPQPREFTAVDLTALEEED